MRVKSITSAKPRTVYAVKTSTGTYIADGLAHHNCVGCNMFKQGEQYLYSKALDMKYGNGTAEELMSRRFETHKFTTTELEEIIHDAKEQIKFYENQ
jgi:hypothetical protein